MTNKDKINYCEIHQRKTQKPLIDIFSSNPIPPCSTPSLTFNLECPFEFIVLDFILLAHYKSPPSPSFLPHIPQKSSGTWGTGHKCWGVTCAHWSSALRRLLKGGSGENAHLSGSLNLLIIYMAVRDSQRHTQQGCGCWGECLCESAWAQNWREKWRKTARSWRRNEVKLILKAWIYTWLGANTFCRLLLNDMGTDKPCRRDMWPSYASSNTLRCCWKGQLSVSVSVHQPWSILFPQKNISFCRWYSTDVSIWFCCHS